jgi:uncharacterized membrane protein YjgN (DUF898 family)
MSDESQYDIADGDETEGLVRLPFEFRGMAGEFFGIWIVNLLLSILTLGIYSAWAKVRTKRYFYGSTFVDDVAFEYHATPIQILIGRIIAVLAYIIFIITSSVAPVFYLILLVALIFAIPWLVNRSLRFNTRMSSYRNVRLGFGGTYGGAFIVYILWPIAGILSIGLLLPMAARAQQSYIVNNARFGGRPLSADLKISAFYKVYFIGLLIMIALFVQFGFAAYDLAVNTDGTDPGIAATMSLMTSYMIFLFGLLFVGVYIQTLVTNLVFNTMKLDDAHSFSSKMSPFRMLWITLTNTLAIALTFGLMYPWAQVRQVKYRASKTAFFAASDLSEFVSTLEDEDSAVGEELAEIFDIEIGI